MEVTTLALAVDSSQVNTASTALQKMAAEGFKAESVVAKLANTAQLQGRALNAGIVKNAAAAADSIKSLTSATSALSSAQDFSRTTAGLSAAAAQANAATGAVRAFGAAVAASAAVAPKFAAAPQATTVQQIAQTPVSVLARQNAPVVDIDSGPINAAAAALDKLVDQMGKVQAASRGLASATQAQGNALDGAASKAGAVAAAYDRIEAAAARASGSASKFNAFGSLGGAQAPAQFNGLGSLSGQSPALAPNVTKAVAAVSGSVAGVPGGNRATSAFSGVGGQVEDLGKKAKLTAFQTQQLSFQLNDLFVQVASGQSPLTALIQQGSQLNGTFGGTKGTLSALASLITPTTVAIGGAAAAVGGLAYAYMQGAAQSKAFNEAILLSGNYAGQTNGSINRLAESVAESTKTSVGTAREFANALIKTGEIGPRAMGLATDAVVRYGEATGKTADDAAADFAKMARDPAKFAQELNKSWNAWTAAELDAIKAMQEGGRVSDAQVEVLKRVQERLQGLHQNLGDVEKATNTLSTAMGNLKDAFFAIGRDRTLEDRIKQLQGILDQPVSTGFFASIDNGIRNSLNAVNEALGASKRKRENFFANSTDAREEARSLQGENFRKLDRENERALAAEREKRDIAADSVIDPVMKAAKTYKRVEDNPEYQKARTKLTSAFQDKADNGRAISREEQNAAFAQLRKQFAPPKASGANEAAQVLREQLGEDLGAFKAALAAEKETLAFHQREMQGIYQAGGISLKAFFDDKRASIADGVKAETAELDKEIARLEQYRDAIKDPSEKVRTQKQINQVQAEKAKVQTAGERDAKLVNLEQAASFKQLDEAVLNYRANLLQMAGDELGAAKIRAQITEQNASILAAQAGGKISDDEIAKQKSLLAATAEFADVQRQAGLLSQSTSRAEEAAYLVAEQGGKSLLETENAIYAVRSRAADQLGELARKASELAAVSTDPKVKQFAADMALLYANAVDKMDPALNRLREAQRNLAAGITNSIDNGVATFAPAYADQRKTARDEIKDERDKFDRKIEILEGYLATTRDKNDQARLREKIKNLEAQKDSVKGESKTGSFLKTVDKQFVQPIAGQALATVNKLLITDPLNEYLKGQFKSLTEGEGLFAGIFKGALGIKDAKVDPKVLAEQAAATATDTLKNSLTAQTSAVEASTTALQALANAANAAAGGATPNSKPLTVEPGSRQAAPSLGDFARADRALGASQATPEDAAATAALVDARSAVEVMGATSKDAAVTVAAMAQAAGKGGGALGLLPSIVNLFQTAVSAMNVSSAASGGGGGGGMLGSIAGLFGSSGGATAASTNASALAPEAADIITSFIFHKGGVVGGSAMSRGTPSSVFANAPRYHTGGIVGQKADGARAALAAAALKHGEVPAILMRNEEVLRRDDPRHRENLGSEVFAKLMQSKGENSASVLQGLLSRLGVKDEPATSALKVAGARELGGPVSAGKLYRVNEKRPELLNVGNKQFLMMGSQGGSVDPNPGAKAQSGQVQQLHVTVAMPQGANAATAQQFGLIAGRQIQTATRRNG